MLFKKLIFFSALLSCVVPVIAMNVKRAGSQLEGNPAKRQKIWDTALEGRPLQDAYNNGDIFEFWIRLESGAKPNEVGPDGNPIILTTQLGGKFNKEDQKISYELLKNHGANINAKAFNTGINLAHIAVDNRNPEFLTQVLSDGVKPKPDFDGCTPLFCTNQPKIGRQLCDAGNKVGRQDYKRRSALFGVATDDPLDVKMAEFLVIRDPRIVAHRDCKNENAFERSARKYGNPNPDLRDEKTARRIVVNNIFSQRGNPVFADRFRQMGDRDPRTGITNFSLKHLRETE